MERNKGAAVIHTTVQGPRRHYLLERKVGQIIRFFGSDAPIPIVINRVKLAVCIVIGVVAPVVLALSAVVFSSHRRYR